MPKDDGRKQSKKKPSQKEQAGRTQEADVFKQKVEEIKEKMEWRDYMPER